MHGWRRACVCVCVCPSLARTRCRRTPLTDLPVCGLFLIPLPLRAAGAAAVHGLLFRNRPVVVLGRPCFRRRQPTARLALGEGGRVTGLVGGQEGKAREPRRRFPPAASPSRRGANERTVCRYGRPGASGRRWSPSSAGPSVVRWTSLARMRRGVVDCAGWVRTGCFHWNFQPTGMPPPPGLRYDGSRL